MDLGLTGQGGESVASGEQGRILCLNVLGQPSDALAVSLSHNNTAHEHLDRPDTLERDLALTSSLVETELVAQLILADSIGVIDLVSENEEGNLRELLHGEESIELGLGFGEALVILGVNQEDDSANFGEVVLPETAGLLVTTEIESREAVVADGQLLGGRVCGRLQDGDTVVLQHVQQCGLAGIVQTEEEKLGVLIEETQRGQDIVEPVDDPHGEGPESGNNGN